HRRHRQLGAVLLRGAVPVRRDVRGALRPARLPVDSPLAGAATGPGAAPGHHRFHAGVAAAVPLRHRRSLHAGQHRQRRPRVRAAGGHGPRRPVWPRRPPAAGLIVVFSPGVSMDYQQLLKTLTPDIYENLKRAVELGKWPNGEPLTPEQRETCLQAVIAWDAM